MSNFRKTSENLSITNIRIFQSIESTAQIMAGKSQYVTRRPQELIVLSSLVHCTLVMIRLVISGKGVGQIYVIEGTMRQDQSKNILKSCLIPQLQEWFQESPKIFMQGGAPCHTTRFVKTFQENKKIPVLRLPGNLPEMKPIENLWECLKWELEKEIITKKISLRGFITKITTKN